MKARLVEEKGDHYVMHDGKAPFRVPHFGLSPEMHAKIRAMAEKKSEPVKMAQGGMTPEQEAAFDRDYAASHPEDVAAPGGGAGGGGEQPAGVAPPPGYLSDVVNAIGHPFAKLLGEKEALPPSVVEQGRAAGAPWAGGAAGAGPDIGQGGAGGSGGGDRPVLAPTATQTATVAKPPPARTAPTASKPVASAPVKPTLAGAFDRAGVNPEPPPEAPPAEPSPQELIGEAQANEARAKVTAIAAAQDQQRAIETERQRAFAAAKEHSDAVLAKHAAAVDEMARVDTSVDPGRYWASRSTGGKIATIAGLILGAFGAGADGQNRAAQMLDSAINRDLEAQKAEHTIRLQRGKAAVEGYQTHYSMARELTNDEQAAFNLAKASAKENVALELEKAAATAAVPEAQQNAKLAAAGARQAAEKNRADAAKTLAETHLAEAQARKASGAAAGGPPLTGGEEALTRYEQAWKTGGGRTGFVTQHIAGTAANDVGDIRGATATAIATQISAGKAPRPALIEHIQSLLAKPGDDQKTGELKHAELRRFLKGVRSRGGGGAEPDEGDLED